MCSERHCIEKIIASYLNRIDTLLISYTTFMCIPPWTNHSSIARPTHNLWLIILGAELEYYLCSLSKIKKINEIKNDTQ